MIICVDIEIIQEINTEINAETKRDGPETYRHGGNTGGDHDPYGERLLAERGYKIRERRQASA